MTPCRLVRNYRLLAKACSFLLWLLSRASKLFRIDSHYNLHGVVSNKPWIPLIVAVRTSDFPWLNCSLNMLQSAFNLSINGECCGHNHSADINSMLQMFTQPLKCFVRPRNDSPVTVHEWSDGQVSRLEHQSQSLLNYLQEPHESIYRYIPLLFAEDWLELLVRMRELQSSNRCPNRSFCGFPQFLITNSEICMFNSPCIIS
jgi:hypothetical protein